MIIFSGAPVCGLGLGPGRCSCLFNTRAATTAVDNKTFKFIRILVSWLAGSIRS